jgi:hypothetical protein
MQDKTIWISVALDNKINLYHVQQKPKKFKSMETYGTHLFHH